ncbi:MAG: hypothetical protein QG635_1321, partial [Bacteroidota bacterium]|nr:hypothetical protein [Bacteroidota bacterium]
MKTLILFFVVIVLSSFSLWSQKNEDCLACHSEPDITMEKNGRNISLTVKKYSLARSVHGKLQCIGCHTGFNPDDIPHKEIIQAVNCTESCHKNASDKHLFHPDMLKIGAKKGEYSNCKKCHGTHEIISFKSFESQTHFTNSTNFCGVCHKDEKNDHLESQHFVELNKNNNIAPTCIFCHSYPITKGHLQNEAMLKINQEKLCLSCHLNNPNSTSKYAKSLLNYETSVHGAAIKRGNENAAVCVDCHGTHRLQKANDDKSGINRFKIPDVCGKCHVSVSQEYKSSIHGFGLKHGNKDVPGCTYCHGEHNITPLPKLAPKVFEMNRIKESTAIRTKMLYCVFCHTNDEMMSKYNISTIDKAHEWLPNISKHWRSEERR